MGLGEGVVKVGGRGKDTPALAHLTLNPGRGYDHHRKMNFSRAPFTLGSWEGQEEMLLPCSHFQKNIYLCFTDYAKAFDCVDHTKLWKLLREMGIPGHLTCFLRNLYAGQEATVRTGHGTMDWFQIGTGVHQGYILSPYLFNLYTKYIMRNARLDEAQAGIKMARRNINDFS